MNDAERFWSKVAIEHPERCWLWTASTYKGGYGRFGIGPRGPNRARYAHRVSYELCVGEIPHGMQLDHLCRNPSCVNPAHLEPVSGRENTIRGESFSAINARKTHCIRGHDLATHANVRRGKRHCRECQRIRNARRSVAA